MAVKGNKMPLTALFYNRTPRHAAARRGERGRKISDSEGRIAEAVHQCVDGLAIPASFPPVIANALIVGAFEITVFFSDSAPTATMAVFNAVAVGVGEIISCCVLGVALVKLVESNESLNKIFAEQ